MGKVPITRRGFTLTLLSGPVMGAAAYDPLAARQPQSQPLDLTVRDAKRSRDIPVRIYLPDSRASAPVVLFSHGLGGSHEGNRFMGDHWSARGYAAVFLQHPGSDTAVWRDVPVAERLAAMRKAASLDNFLLRVHDVPAVLNTLAGWNAAADHSLRGRLDLARAGMSGHSFGAVTTEAVSGEAFPGGISFTDARIRAAIAFSPSSPRARDPKQAFGSVLIPWLLMTGTKDTVIIGDADLESRLAVFPSLPPGEKYELVLDRAEHSAFTDRALPGDTEPRNPNHHRAILAISTAFWDTFLRHDGAAKAWLEGSGPRSVLESKDRWQKK